MKNFILYQQDFGAPPPPPPPVPGSTPPPPPPVMGPGVSSDKASSRAIWALVLGIAAWVLCGIFASIPAWIMGRNEIRDIDSGQSSPAGRSMAQIGMWLGIISTILNILVIIGVLIYFVFIVAIIGAGN